MNLEICQAQRKRDFISQFAEVLEKGLYPRSEDSGFYTLYYKIAEAATLADGLACSVEPNAITIPLIHTYADDFLLVSEDEIRDAVTFSWDRFGERIEGSAATALAVAQYRKISKPVVLIISGRNIQPKIHEQIITASAK